MHNYVAKEVLFVKNFYDYDDFFEEQEDDDVFDADKISDSDYEENYPTMEEYNRIHKQKYNY